MPDCSFGSKVRLLTRKDYDRVFARPLRAGTAAILILARSNDHGYARLGLIVPKKALRRAVWRNRVKRVIRESFRLMRNQLPSLDIVVIARTECRSLTNQELFCILSRLWLNISQRSKKMQNPAFGSPGL